MLLDRSGCGNLHSDRLLPPSFGGTMLLFLRGAFLLVTRNMLGMDIGVIKKGGLFQTFWLTVCVSDKIISLRGNPGF